MTLGMRGLLNAVSYYPCYLITKRKRNWVFFCHRFYSVAGALCHSPRNPWPSPSLKDRKDRNLSSLADVAASNNAEIEPRGHSETRGLASELHEEHVHRICNVVYRVRWGKVGDVVQFLQSDDACARMHLSETMVVDLLQKFGDDWKSALGFFQWAGMQPGYEHGSYAYSKMVDVLGKMRQIYAMWMLVGEMHRRGLVTVETVGKVMRRLTAAGRWEEAVKTFDGLETMGLRKDAETMNLLLDTLCKEKKAEIACEVYLCYKADIAPDAHTFNIFVHGWCLVGSTDKAAEVILEMKGAGIAPSVVTYSNVVRAHCNQSNFCKVFEILDKMTAKGCPPNTITYTSVINSLARLDEIEAILEIVDRMRTAGCQPDVHFYNSLISILGRAGRIQEACHVFEVEMRQNGVSPDLSTYNSMISILCQHSLGQNALDLLKEIEWSTLKPNLNTFSPLLKLCMRVGNAENLLCNLLNDIVNRHHLFLDSATYDLLIHGFCKTGKCESAFLLFEEMVSRDIFPRDKKTYDLLLAEAERRGLCNTIDWIKDVMKRGHLHHKRPI